MMVHSLLLHVKIDLACTTEPHGCLISLCCGEIRVRSLSGLNRSLPKPLIYHGPLAQTVSSQNRRVKHADKHHKCRLMSLDAAVCPAAFESLRFIKVNPALRYKTFLNRMFAFRFASLDALNGAPCIFFFSLQSRSEKTRW